MFANETEDGDILLTWNQLDLFYYQTKKRKRMILNENLR